MKTLAKSALGIAVAAALASNSVQASEAVTMDPSLTFTYKNFYWKEDGKNSSDHQGGHDYDLKEWVHGLIADFDSGYVNDLVGAVVTAGYAGPLSIKKEYHSASNVPGGSDGKGDSISGFQQAYLKAQHSFSGVDFSGSVGVKQRGLETYNDSGSRVLAASSTGFDISAGFEGANLYYTEIKGFSDRDESTLNNDLVLEYTNYNDSFNENDDEKVELDVEKIQIIGATFRYQGLDLVAEYGKSEETIKQTFLKAGYGFELDDMSYVDVDVRYGQSKTAGANGDAAFGDDYKSSYYNLNATYNYGSAYAGLGYNKTKDNDFVDYYAAGYNDSFNSSLAQWEDYSLAGEKAYLVNAGYNFADQGLEGLSWDVWFAKGDNAEEINDFKRREYGSYVSYAFDGSLDGLSVAWLYVNYRAQGSVDVAQDKVRQGTLYDQDVNRLYLTYSVAAF